jgi:hypothetical protein
VAQPVDRTFTDLTGQPIEILIPEATRARMPGT